MVSTMNLEAVDSKFKTHLGLSNVSNLKYDLFIRADSALAWYTPARTHSISGLKFRVLKLTFLALKMMVKIGLEFILKFTEPLQRYLLFNLPGQFSPIGQIF